MLLSVEVCCLFISIHTVVTSHCFLYLLRIHSASLTALSMICCTRSWSSSSLCCSYSFLKKDTCYYITDLRESSFQALVNTVCGPPDGDSVEGRGVRGELVAAPQQELVQGPGLPCFSCCRTEVSCTIASHFSYAPDTISISGICIELIESSLTTS